MTHLNYLTTLGLSQPKAPSLDFLRTFTERHLERFSFNNLAVLLHQEISLQSQAILHKVVQQGLGGYCFEHNKLAYEALSLCGFEVRLVLARVINNDERPVPRTHRMTLVTLAGEHYLVDIGFGAACPIKPLALANRLPQQAGFERYQVVQNNQQEYELWQLRENGPFLLYRFDLAHYSDADCEMGHFYSHKHPHAVFVNNLVVSQKSARETYVITNERLTHHSASGRESRLIASSESLFEALTQVFKLSIEQEVCEFLFTHYLAPRLDNMQP